MQVFNPMVTQGGMYGDNDELFLCMVDKRKAFSLVSIGDHCQRSSPSRISDTLRVGFEPAQNLSSGFATLWVSVNLHM